MATQLAEALQNAGFETSQDKLKRLATDALASSQSVEAACDPFFDVIRGDPVLLCSLFEPYRMTALRTFLYERQREMQRAEWDRQDRERVPPPPTPSFGSWATSRDEAKARYNTSRDAPKVRPSKVENAQPDSTHVSPELEERVPAPILPPFTERRAARETIIMSMMLDTVLVNGTPIRHVTPKQALAWAATGERYARWIRMIVAGNEDSNMTIGQICTDKEAAKFFIKAEEKCI